jgi:integrating conjugative element protein (TIGR03749 family)
MKHWIFKLLLTVLLATASTVALAVEILKWERLPLSVPLKVNEERVIFIDKNVRVGMERPVSDRLRLQSAGGTLYIKALGELAKSRLQVQVIETGEIILIDLFTVDGDSETDTSESIRIVDGRQIGSDENPKVSEGYEAKVAESLKIPAPVALTRYASQSLYAPIRTVEPVPGLRKAALRIHNRLRLFPTERIIGSPLVAYQLGSYTVTAVKLRNASPKRIDLDPRKVQGDFYSTTFQHTWLGSAGTAEDTTVAYLVTKDHGLEKALLPFSVIPDVPVDKKKDEKAESAKKENADEK